MCAWTSLQTALCLVWLRILSTLRTLLRTSVCRSSQTCSVQPEKPSPSRIADAPFGVSLLHCRPRHSFETLLQCQCFPGDDFVVIRLLTSAVCFVTLP